MTAVSYLNSSHPLPLATHHQSPFLLCSDAGSTVHTFVVQTRHLLRRLGIADVSRH